MADITTVLTPLSLVASSSNAAGATTRGTGDLRGTHGGLLTLKMTNGGTGPTLLCEARIMVAHDDGSTPAAGAAGSVWKTLHILGGPSGNNGIAEHHVVLPPCCHVQVEFTGNTGQAVTVEAAVTVYTKLVST